MRTHRLKCWPEPFQAMVDGRKRFEFRKDDRGFCVGDELLLREWDPAPFNDASYGAVGYTRRELRGEVTYVLRGFGVPDGYDVMGISEVSR